MIRSKYIKHHPNGVSIDIYITPGAGKDCIRGEREGRLWIAVSASPHEGKANKALIEFVANFFKVSKSCVDLEKGSTSRFKKITVSGITCEEASKRINSAK